MKTSHSISFFVLILVVAAGIFLFVDNKRVESQPNIVKYQVACDSAKIDSKIFALKGNTSLIGAMISFYQIPLSDEQSSELSDMEVKLDEKSWIFDYVVAQIPTKSLCDLAQLDYVKKIFIPGESANQNDISKL